MFDAHCHIIDEAFVGYEKEYISNANRNDVRGFLLVGLNNKHILECIDFAKQNKNVFVAAGWFPTDTKELENQQTWDEFEHIISNNLEYIKAIGEIGLDYHYEETKIGREIQKKYFIKQIELANKYGLPIDIHMRDSVQDTYEILKENKVNKGAIIHCYNASIEMTKLFINLGCYFSIGGIITYKNIGSLKDAIKIMPIDKILLETDSPYLAPVPLRGKRNESANLIWIAERIAELRLISVDDIKNATERNSLYVFHVKYE